MKKYKALVLTSNSLRHKYYAKVVSEYFDVQGVISEPKSNYYDKVREESKTVREHFKNLSLYEKQFFDNVSFPHDIELLELQKSEINNQEVVDWAKNKSIDVIFLFGTAILNDNWLIPFENKIVNLHLGLSPFYRGSATLFWPIYNNELECLGVTIHLAVKKVDAGNMIARIKPSLEEGDNYYTINYKAIKKAIDQMPEIVIEYLNGGINLLEQDLNLSKVYRKNGTVLTVPCTLSNIILYKLAYQ